jgi:hypothetical protein
MLCTRVIRKLDRIHNLAPISAYVARGPGETGQYTRPRQIPVAGEERLLLYHPHNHVLRVIGCSTPAWSAMALPGSSLSPDLYSLRLNLTG